MRTLAMVVLLTVAACWVTPREVQNKIDEFEPTDTSEQPTGDTGTPG